MFSGNCLRGFVHEAGRWNGDLLSDLVDVERPNDVCRGFRRARTVSTSRSRAVVVRRSAEEIKRTKLSTFEMGSFGLERKEFGLFVVFGCLNSKSLFF